MKAWSYSALTGFEQCPRRHYELNVAKNFTEGYSEALQEGSAIHKAIENYIKNGQNLPLGLKYLEPIVRPLVELEGTKVVEEKLALTKDLEPTGWFSKNVWVRTVIDFGVHLPKGMLLVDWKTGKRKDNPDQLALMAACAMAADQSLEQVRAAFFWLKESRATMIDAQNYTRDDLADIWSKFMRRQDVFQKAFADTKFPPRPSGLCKRWCPVSTCPYWGA